MSEGASNNGRTLTHCRHIYQDIGESICPDCGRDTHETDWEKEAQLHREWIASGKAKFGGWWSI